VKKPTTRFEVVPLTEVPRKTAPIAGNKSVLGVEGSVPCEAKARLVAEFGSATTRFSVAVKKLHRKMGTSPKEEYDWLEKVTDQARMGCERARLALKQHVAAHRC
jgi:hypothetical protein